jgi:DNA-directed RNA polymerase sigma subunit (sigma70/sigma32)
MLTASKRLSDRRILDKLLPVLSPIERRIINRRFGLDGEPEQTLVEIGADMNVTGTRIRQLEERAKKKIANEYRRLCIEASAFQFQKDGKRTFVSVSRMFGEG